VSAGVSARRVETSGECPLGVTIYESFARSPGPTVLVLGGVHGDEVGGVFAAGIIASAGWELLRGRLAVVPIAHEVAFNSNSRTSPLDGGNLAREFPGTNVGSPTQRLANLLLEKCIRDADVLVDLHTSNVGTDMPMFVGCLDDGTPHAARAVEFAAGFGMEIVWTHPAIAPGRTLSSAAALGIPALYVESPDGGVIHDAVTEAYTDGVKSILEALEMLPPGRTRTAPAHWLHGNGDVDSFAAARVSGLFTRSTRLMERVARGQIVGRTFDVLGNVNEEVTAPADGYITTLRRASVITIGEPLVGVAPERPMSLNLVSDAVHERFGKQ